MRSHQVLRWAISSKCGLQLCISLILWRCSCSFVLLPANDYSTCHDIRCHNIVWHIGLISCHLLIRLSQSILSWTIINYRCSILIKIFIWREIQWVVSAIYRFINRVFFGASVWFRSLFLLCFLCFACRGRIHSLCELPSRDAFSRRLSIHIIDRLPVYLFHLIFWFSLGNKSFWERVFIYVVLVIKLRHGEATHSLRPISADLIVINTGSLLKTLVVMLHRLVVLNWGLQYLVVLVDAWYMFDWSVWHVVESRNVYGMLLGFGERFTRAARSPFVALNNLVSSHNKVHLTCFRFIRVETWWRFTFHVHAFFFVTHHHRFWMILVAYLLLVGMTRSR